MSSADTQFSKVRLEMLCDRIFAIAMALLVLELKPPELPRHATSIEIWHALLAAAITQSAIGLTTRRLTTRR